MNEIYFPSCNFNKASPEAAKRLRSYLKEKMPVAGCCRYDKTPWETGSIGLYFCKLAGRLWNPTQITYCCRKTCLSG